MTKTHYALAVMSGEIALPVTASSLNSQVVVGGWAALTRVISKHQKCIV